MIDHEITVRGFDDMISSVGVGDEFFWLEKL
jgi:hypothetical protein